MVERRLDPRREAQRPLPSARLGLFPLEVTSVVIAQYNNYGVTLKPQPTLSINTNKPVSLLYTRRVIPYVYYKNGLTF